MTILGTNHMRLITALAALSGVAAGATWNEIDGGIPRTPVGVRTVVADPSFVFNGLRSKRDDCRFPCRAVQKHR